MSEVVAAGMWRGPWSGGGERAVASSGCGSVNWLMCGM